MRIWLRQGRRTTPGCSAGGRRTPGSHAGTELSSQGLSEIPRQGRCPTSSVRAAQELWLGRLLPPQQQIQSWRITEWNKIQQCNKITRHLARLKRSEREQPEFVQKVARPLRVTSCLGSPAKGREGFKCPFGCFPRVLFHRGSQGEEWDRQTSEQGRDADSLRNKEAKSNCAASTAAINLSVYSHGRPFLSA